MIRRCAECGEEFISHHNSKCCSNECRSIYKKRVDKIYKQKYKKPNIQRPPATKMCKQNDCLYHSIEGDENGCDFCYLTGETRGCSILECTRYITSTVQERRRFRNSKLKESV